MIPAKTPNTVSIRTPGAPSLVATGLNVEEGEAEEEEEEEEDSGVFVQY